MTTKELKPANIVVPKNSLEEDDDKNAALMIGSPRVGTPRPLLSKQSSQRASCLCSPTTHAGSFRCRLHRSSLHHNHSNSEGSGLSELADKSDI